VGETAQEAQVFFSSTFSVGWRAEVFFVTLQWTVHILSWHHSFCSYLVFNNIPGHVSV
jgi:hypothetical protein